MSNQSPIDISKLNEAEFREWVDSFDVVVSDCDGKAQILKKTEDTKK